MISAPVNYFSPPLSKAKEILRSTRGQRTKGALDSIRPEYGLAASAVFEAIRALDSNSSPASVTAVAKMAFAISVIVDRAVSNTANEVERDMGRDLSVLMADYALDLSSEGSHLWHVLQRRCWFPLL